MAITPRDIEIDPSRGKPFDPVAAGRTLLLQSRSGALSTLDPGGFPYGVATNVIADHDASPVFFAARLALHARNVAADSRVSLALADFGKPDLLTRPRMTLTGHARAVEGAAEERLRLRWLARFPKAKLYLQLPDAMLFRLEVLDVTLGGGPGRNAGKVTFRDLRIATDGAGPLLGAEAAEIAALNADPALPPALARAAGARAGRWRAVTLDPLGVDLSDGETLLRCGFPGRATTPAAFRAAVRTLAGAG